MTLPQPDKQTDRYISDRQGIHARSDLDQRANTSDSLPDVLKHSRTRVVYGAGALDQLGKQARREGASHILLVTDPGIEEAGHVNRALTSVREAKLTVTLFDGVRENPTTEHVAKGVEAAKKANIDFIVGLGGGSSMDCAKGINFIFTNGGEMKDYWGVGKAAKPMLPMIAVPTTAGTGSEAQSFALIADPDTHQKMACGDIKAACRVAILDPDLTRTQPPAVAAATSIDAVAHVVETAGTTKRSDVSLTFTREAWQRIDRSFERANLDLNDDPARADMLLGAHLAGAAIEHSMLGAAHSCANPLTSRFGIVHGQAVGLVLPHVVRFNCEHDQTHYKELGMTSDELATRLDSMLIVAKLPRRLRDIGISERDLPSLADEAAKQWTAQFNPRAVAATDLLEVLRRAY